MSQKESMQNTIKTLQIRSENIEKLLEKGNRCVIIHIGSHSTKIGFANDKVPHRVRTLVAYKVRRPQEHKHHQSVFQQQDFVSEFDNFQTQLKQSGCISTTPKVNKGKPRAKSELKMRLPQRPFQSHPLFDQQAMWVCDNPQYIVRRPVKYGMIDIQSSALSDCIQDLVNIIQFCLKEKLKIRTPYDSFSSVLILPDVFCRPHVKSLVTEIFKQIGFKSIYIHTQSVLACFASTLGSSCVVDIGYEKINVACIEEGIILPGTLIRKNFGGKSISETLFKQIGLRNMISLNKSAVSIDINNEGDLFQLENVKEKACFLKDIEEYNNRVYEMLFIRAGKEESVYLPHSQAFCLCPNSLFNNLWNQLQKPLYTQYFDYNSKLFQLYSDPEDPFEEFSGGGETIPAATDHPYYNVDMSQPFIYNPLEDIIAYSLANVKDVEMRRKMMSNILLVGGTSHLPRLAEQLQPKLLQKVKIYDPTVEKVEFTDLSLREIPPIFTSWVGGTVIPKLDSVKELWIERGKFLGDCEQEVELQDQLTFEKRFFNKKEVSQEWGMRYLKEKLPFQW